jgi:hypothetical protein
MATISKSEIIEALKCLGEVAAAQGEEIELVLIGGALIVLQELAGNQEEVWEAVSPYLVPGSELKAQYAFKDLWEMAHGDD